MYCNDTGALAIAQGREKKCSQAAEEQMVKVKGSPALSHHLRLCPSSYVSTGSGSFTWLSCVTAMVSVTAVVSITTVVSLPWCHRRGECPLSCAPADGRLLGCAWAVTGGKQRQSL